jgi:L-phenylalanine/L-methionine N-acetyltransferase
MPTNASFWRVIPLELRNDRQGAADQAHWRQESEVHSMSEIQDIPLVRALNPSDTEAVHTILTSASVIDGTMRIPLAPLHQTVERLAPQLGLYHLVAELRGKVVGFGELLTYPQHPRHAHVGEINMVATDPAYERRGIGRLLTGALVDLGDAWLNLRRLQLIVFTDNTHAIALYESFGFEPEGVLRGFGYKRGNYIDALMMARLKVASGEADSGPVTEE